MSVCPSCGFRNPGSDPFCRNPACGAFLGWGDDETSSKRRPPLRIDQSGVGQPGSEDAPAEDTQPFDAAAEARRPDAPSRPAPAPDAGQGARSAPEPPPAPRSPSAPSGSSGRDAGTAVSTSWFDRGDSGSWAPLPPPPGMSEPPPPRRQPEPPERAAGTPEAPRQARPAGATPPPSQPPRQAGPPPPAAPPPRPAEPPAQTGQQPRPAGPPSPPGEAPGRGGSPTLGPLRPAGPPPPRMRLGEGRPPGRDPGQAEPPREAPRQEREAGPWESPEPPRPPEWKTALGRGREPSQPRDWSPFSQPPEPGGEQGPYGEATRGQGPHGEATGAAGPYGEAGEAEPQVSREAVRAAIRGEAIPRGALPDAGARGSRAARGGRADRLTLPPATGEASSRRDNAFPSEAELLKRPSRWQRMLRRLPVAVPGEGALRKAPSVRDRERQRTRLRFGVLVAVIVLVGGGLWLASVRGRSSSDTGATSPTAPPPALARVAPTSVAASSQSGSRVADNVIDGKLGTFWSRLVPSEDDQPFLRFSFARPVDLGRVTIAAGASGAEFSKRPRPQEIELRFSGGTTLRTTLADKPEFQTVTFRAREVDRVRLVALSTYPSSGPQRTSISEVRFFAVKS